MSEGMNPRHLSPLTPPLARVSGLRTVKIIKDMARGRLIEMVQYTFLIGFIVG